jgi:hypothetical protein
MTDASLIDMAPPVITTASPLLHHPLGHAPHHSDSWLMHQNQTASRCIFL